MRRLHGCQINPRLGHLAGSRPEPMPPRPLGCRTPTYLIQCLSSAEGIAAQGGTPTMGPSSAARRQAAARAAPASALHATQQQEGWQWESPLTDMTRLVRGTHTPEGIREGLASKHLAANHCKRTRYCMWQRHLGEQPARVGGLHNPGSCKGCKQGTVSGRSCLPATHAHLSSCVSSLCLTCSSFPRSCSCCCTCCVLMACACCCCCCRCTPPGCFGWCCCPWLLPADCMAAGEPDALSCLHKSRVDGEHLARITTVWYQHMKKRTAYTAPASLR